MGVATVGLTMSNQTTNNRTTITAELASNLVCAVAMLAAVWLAAAIIMLWAI